MAEEADRLDLVMVDRIVALQIVQVEVVDLPVDEGADEVARVEQMDRLRGSADEIGVSGGAAVGREELRDRNRPVEEDQQDAGDQREAVPLELPPHQSPLRRQIDTL